VDKPESVSMNFSMEDPTFFVCQILVTQNPYHFKWEDDIPKGTKYQKMQESPNNFLECVNVTAKVLYLQSQKTKSGKMYSYRLHVFSICVIWTFAHFSGTVKIQMHCYKSNLTTGITGHTDGDDLPLHFIKYSPY